MTCEKCSAELVLVKAIKWSTGAVTEVYECRGLAKHVKVQETDGREETAE